MKEQSVKRDHRVIWFTHLSPRMAACFDKRRPEEPFVILINSTVTIWERMRPSPNGRSTNGIKVISGTDVWDPIPMGSSFELGTIDDGVASMAPSPAPQTVQSKEAVPDPVPSKPECPPARGPGASRFFDRYLFADYSGAKASSVQKKAIAVAIAEAHGPVQRLRQPFTRETLFQEMARQLKQATDESKRLCLGIDHQYSIPFGLAAELGLQELTWRTLLERLVLGTYGPDAPPLQEPAVFGHRFNSWLQRTYPGSEAYFWSATKSAQYDIPSNQPRLSDDPALFRLTEMRRAITGTGSAKPLCRLGDNGTVGGQTLLGLAKLYDLLRFSQSNRIPLKVWPMDGLDIREYDGHHVLVEPYPAAVRPPEVERDDWNDAASSLVFMKMYDERGALPRLLDLSALEPGPCACVKLEGWIVGHDPIMSR